MKQIKSRELSSLLKKGLSHYQFLFLGEEEGEKKKYFDKMADLFFSSMPPEERSIERFFLQKNQSEGDSIVKAAEFALSQSMFSSKKMCIIHDVNRLSNKGDTSLLNEIITDLPSDTLLIMTSTANKNPSTIKKDNLNAIQPVIFWKYFEKDLMQYAQAEFKKLNKTIDFQAVKRLLSFTGRDMSKIDEAIKKIELSVEDSIINEETIVRIVADEKEVNVFEFIESLLQKSKNSFQLLKKVVDQGTHELVILSLLTRELEKIEAYHHLKKSGQPNDMIFKELKIPYRGTQSFLGRIRLFSEEKLSALFPLVFETDLMCKSEKRDGFLNNPLYDLVYKIIAE